MTVTINGTTGITSPEVVLDNAAADGGQVVLKSSGYSDWNWDNYSGRLRAYYSATEYFTITNSGNVGIGTSSPTSSNGNVGKILQTAASGNTSATTISSTAGTGIDNAGIFEARATAQTSGSDRLGQIYFGRENTSTTALSSYAAFGTSGSGTFAERMRIDSSGNLLVGTSSLIVGNERLSISQPTSTYWAQCIQLGNSANGSIITNTSGTASYTAWSFRNNGTTFSLCGSITVSGTSTAYATSSDYRLKENVQPMRNALERLAALKPVTYTWKSDGTSSEGFIAHELQEVVPDAVVGEKDAVDADGNPVYQGIDTSFLVATLTAAIQEQQALITTLTARIEALEAKNA